MRRKSRAGLARKATNKVRPIQSRTRRTKADIRAVQNSKSGRYVQHSLCHTHILANMLCEAHVLQSGCNRPLNAWLLVFGAGCLVSNW